MEVEAELPQPVPREPEERARPRPPGPHGELADFSTDRRVLALSGMAVAIGAAAALVAYALVWLIAVITNLAYYQRLSSHFVSPAGRQGVPIAGEHGELVGIITRSDLMRALEGDDGRAASVLDAGTRDLVVGHPDELLREAVGRMLARDICRLPIVDRHDRSRLVGYLGRAGIMRARVRLFEEENLRERGPGAG
jgi:CBS domain-containing protein